MSRWTLSERIVGVTIGAFFFGFVMLSIVAGAAWWVLALLSPFILLQSYSLLACLFDWRWLSLTTVLLERFVWEHDEVA